MFQAVSVFLTLIFHKVEYRHVWGVVGRFVITFLEIYCWVRWWQNFEKVSISQRYGEKYSGTFFLDMVYFLSAVSSPTLISAFLTASPKHFNFLTAMLLSSLPVYQSCVAPIHLPFALSMIGLPLTLFYRSIQVFHFLCVVHHPSGSVTSSPMVSEAEPQKLSHFA